jgi:hypothetical protein
MWCLQRLLPSTLLGALVLASSGAAFAQGTRGATITGIVRDSLGMPVPAADVVAQPGQYRTRTDSAGAFVLTGLDDGAYTIAARKVGYAPERWDVKLSKNGRLELKFVLGRRVQLDTITVVARSACPPFSLNGFWCRQRSGGSGGVFLDYQDIDDQRVAFIADLFRQIPGFRVELRRSRMGPVPTPARSGFGCINSLVDGMPVTGANPIPTLPSDLSALEVYLKPDSVPEPYQRYTWPELNTHRTGRCSVVLYWTIWAPVSSRQ